MSDSLYVVMPAYNEADNIEFVVEQWHEVVVNTGEASRLVIFNDGSSDNTFEILQKLEHKYPQFIAVDKPNSGHGATCLFAYRYALSAKADFVFQTDSDGQTDPEEFWGFWEQRNEYDFIIGNRKKRQDGSDRVMVTKVLKLLLFFVFGTTVKDSNTPFRLMRSSKLAQILKIIPEDFFLSNAVISMLVVKRHEKHLWIPISFKPRQGGTNSINLKRIFQIGLAAIPDFYMIRKRLKKTGY